MSRTKRGGIIKWVKIELFRKRKMRVPYVSILKYPPCRLLQSIRRVSNVALHTHSPTIRKRHWIVFCTVCFCCWCVVYYCTYWTYRKSFCSTRVNFLFFLYYWHVDAAAAAFVAKTNNPVPNWKAEDERKQFLPSSSSAGVIKALVSAMLFLSVGLHFFGTYVVALRPALDSTERTMDERRRLVRRNLEFQCSAWGEREISNLQINGMIWHLIYYLVSTSSLRPLWLTLSLICAINDDKEKKTNPPFSFEKLIAFWSDVSTENAPHTSQLCMRQFRFSYCRVPRATKSTRSRLYPASCHFVVFIEARNKTSAVFSDAISQQHSRHCS